MSCCLYQVLPRQCSNQWGRNLPPPSLLPDVTAPWLCLQSIFSYYRCLFNKLEVDSPFQLGAFLHVYLFLWPYPSIYCSELLPLCSLHPFHQLLNVVMCTSDIWLSALTDTQLTKPHLGINSFIHKQNKKKMSLHLWHTWRHRQGNTIKYKSPGSENEGEFQSQVNQED